MIIYKLTFPNNKIYIGQTTKLLSTRISGHKADAKREKDITKYSSGSRIGNAIRKYKTFTSEIIETCSKEELDNREEYWIRTLKSQDNNIGYNIKSGGNTVTFTDEVKAKIGKATKERWQNPEIAKRMKEGLRKTGLSQKGKIKTPREKIICKNCGIEFEALPSENRVACSQVCATKLASQVAGDKKIVKTIGIREERKEIILDWALKNKSIVLNCPKNKITPNLGVLLQIIGITDWRTLTACLDTSSRKEFLIQLQDYVKMYAEPS
jgi:group I intron endonuclease